MVLKLMYITNNSDVALIAQKYGVDRIWIDLETLGKEERQKGIYFAESLEQITDILCSLKEDKQKPDSNIGIEIKATATDSLSPFQSKS